MWFKKAKEESVYLGTIIGFDVNKFVKTKERVEGKRIELKIGLKEIQDYTNHLKKLYNKFGDKGLDDILDDRKRQELHNIATESVIQNSFSPEVLKFYKEDKWGRLSSLNFKIRQMINDTASEVMKHTVMAKFKGWIKIAYDLGKESTLDGTEEMELEDNFKEDKGFDVEYQDRKFQRNRDQKDTGKNNDKSPLVTQEDLIRKESQPGVDDYDNSRIM